MSTGVPYLISWNITRRCNLLCAHCYLDAAELSGTDALSHENALAITDEIAALAPGAMLVLTGGEPLLRPGIFELISRAASLGLNPVLGTNGTLLTKETASRLHDSGIKGAGVSLDSCSSSFHDRFRGMDGAWTKALQGMEALRAFNIPFQLQFTLTRENRNEIGRAAAFAIEQGAHAVNYFFLVCTGRGQKAADLAPEEYERALEEIVRTEDKYSGRVLVRARCAPHIVRVAERINPKSPLTKGGTCGCIAGKGYLRVSPEGLVTPCPYIPADGRSQSVLKTSLKETWESGPAFIEMRQPASAGRCAECEYANSCGGCRARAFASTGKVMAEDPWCVHEPKGGEKKNPPSVTVPCWSPEAEERLAKVPAFLRPMIKKGLERYASSKGIAVITPEVMAELREKAGK